MDPKRVECCFTMDDKLLEALEVSYFKVNDLGIDLDYVPNSEVAVSKAGTTEDFDDNVQQEEDVID